MNNFNLLTFCLPRVTFNKLINELFIQPNYPLDF